MTRERITDLLPSSATNHLVRRAMAREQLIAAKVLGDVEETTARSLAADPVAA